MNRRFYHKLGDVNFGDIVYTRKDGKVVACKLVKITNTANATTCLTQYSFIFADGTSKTINVGCGFTDDSESKRFYLTIEDAIKDVNHIQYNIVELNQFLKDKFKFDTKITSFGAQCLGLKVWKWDGFQPKQCFIGHWDYSLYFDVDGSHLGLLKPHKFYLTYEDCAKDNSIEVVTF